jgi:hypothetical protein
MAFINRVSTAYALALAGSLALAPSAVLAHGGGNGGGHGGTHDNMGTGDSQSDSSPNGGMSASHMSEEGMENTNGPNATDRDTGPDRAEDRNGTETDADNDGQDANEQSPTAVPGTDLDETGGD